MFCSRSDFSNFCILISFVGQIYLFLCSSCQGRRKDFSSCKEALAVLGV